MTYIVEKNLTERNGNNQQFLYDESQCYRLKSTESTPITWGSPANSLVSTGGDMWHGWDITNYHKRLAAGELMPMTPWEKNTINGASTGSYDVTAWVDPNNHTKGYYRYFYDNGWNPHGQWHVTEDELYDYAPVAYDMYVAEAAAKVYSSGYDALTALAELTQVKSMFVDIGKRLYKLRLPDDLIRKIIAKRYTSRPASVSARGITQKAKSGKVVLIKDVMSDWLCIRYGWRTLMYDMMSLNKALQNLNSGRTRYSEKTGTSWSSAETQVDVNSYAFFTHTVTVEKKIKIGIRGSVVADIDVPTWQFNPLITAWELIPLSFVMDWFVNVGKTLAAYNFLAFQHRYAAAAGFSVEIEKTLSTTNSNFSSSYRGGTAYQSANSTRKLLVRKPCKVPLLPSCILKLNSLKVMDLVALVAQRWARTKGARI